MRSPENEAVVLAMWADYDREGLAGILKWASDDARWRPHSADRRTFESTEDYRAYVEAALATGIRVDSVRQGIWSHENVVVVRGHLRINRGGHVEDSRMYWLHRIRDGRVEWTASSPDLGGLLAEVGLDDRRLANEALVATHE